VTRFSRKEPECLKDAAIDWIFMAIRHCANLIVFPIGLLRPHTSAHRLAPSPSGTARSEPRPGGQPASVKATGNRRLASSGQAIVVPPRLRAFA
jgi:hypothetical protein